MFEFEIVTIGADFFYGCLGILLLSCCGFLFHLLEYIGFQTGIIREEHVSQRKIYDIDIKKLLKEDKFKT